MKDLIYEKENSISECMCNNIICFFENNTQYHRKDAIGKEQPTHNIKIRNSIRLDIGFSDRFLSIKDYVEDIKNNLIENFQKYVEILKNKNINCIDYKKISIIDLTIHKYNKNEGKFTYHSDEMSIDNDKKKRFITFIWYLNDLEEGGETEFFGSYKIKPKTGKLIFFPSDPLFIHCAKMPLSSDKYILSGWIYKDN